MRPLQVLNTLIFKEAINNVARHSRCAHLDIDVRMTDRRSLRKSSYVSINTISFHLKNICTKLQVHSMSEAVAKALRQRLVQPAAPTYLRSYQR